MVGIKSLQITNDTPKHFFMFFLYVNYNIYCVFSSVYVLWVNSYVSIDKVEKVNATI